MTNLKYRCIMHVHVHTITCPYMYFTAFADKNINFCLLVFVLCLEVLEGSWHLRTL